MPLVAAGALTRVLEPPGVTLLLPARPAVRVELVVVVHEVPPRAHLVAPKAAPLVVDVVLVRVIENLRREAAVPFVGPFPLLLHGESEPLRSRHLASTKECLTSVLKRWRAKSAILFLDSKISVFLWKTIQFNYSIIEYL